MTIDFSFLEYIDDEVKRVRAIEQLCVNAIKLSIEHPNMFKMVQLLGMISITNIGILPIQIDTYKPMIDRYNLQD